MQDSHWKYGEISCLRFRLLFVIRVQDCHLFCRLDGVIECFLAFFGARIQRALNLLPSRALCIPNFATRAQAHMSVTSWRRSTVNAGSARLAGWEDREPALCLPIEQLQEASQLTLTVRNILGEC